MVGLKNDIKIKYIIKVVMSDIYNKVNDMGRGDKIAYLKTLTADQKKAYDNYMSYQRVLKNRNKDRTKYNEYMKPIKNKYREKNRELYRLQNNRDVSNYRARKTLTPDEASKVISSNLKNYIAKLKAIKESNENTVFKKLAANVVSHVYVDSLIGDVLNSQPKKKRGRPPKVDK